MLSIKQTSLGKKKTEDPQSLSHTNCSFWLRVQETLSKHISSGSRLKWDRVWDVYKWMWGFILQPNFKCTTSCKSFLSAITANSSLRWGFPFPQPAGLQAGWVHAYLSKGGSHTQRGCRALRKKHWAGNQETWSLIFILSLTSHFTLAKQLKQLSPNFFLCEGEIVAWGKGNRYRMSTMNKLFEDCKQQFLNEGLISLIL